MLLLVGLAFKVAAVPFHAWAPATYDGAPTPIAAYLSTASKLGGVVAVLYVAVSALGPSLAVAGPILAALAALTMTVGNVVALRQTRMVRLLAWSSIAQAGYILAPLGALATGSEPHAGPRGGGGRGDDRVHGVLRDAGDRRVRLRDRAARRPLTAATIADYRGVARRWPWIGVAFVLALIGLAGLPPGLAGLFAKAIVVKSLLGGGSVWLAIVVGVNAVIGLGYYARVIGVLFTSRSADSIDSAETAGGSAGTVRAGWAVWTALAAATIAALVIGFAPQLVLHVADIAAGR